MKIIAKDFNLNSTLDSGQVFGFVRDGEKWRGAIYGKLVEVSQRGETVSVSGDVLAADVRRYFDLERDLAPVYGLMEAEECLRPAVDAFRGLRLIQQDHWEALACFIISSNNNVKRIQGIWKNLSTRVPSSTRGPRNDKFPSALEIAMCHERFLRELGLGYRAPFLQRTALFVAANPAYLTHIRESDYLDAKARVLAFPGIGEKVADCALLYGFQKYEAFPVDVWILRVMRKLYFKNRRVSEARIRAFGQKRWKSHAGYVQQYLFHSIRNRIL